MMDLDCGRVKLLYKKQRCAIVMARKIRIVLEEGCLDAVGSDWRIRAVRPQ